MDMDVHIRDLRYFLAVAEDLHFTRAAERLFVSQPALSKQIRMLERQLGAALFERDRREVRLTSVGAALLPHARRLLSAWDGAWASVEHAKAAQRSTLVVGMSTSPGRSGLLPAIRARFAVAQPDARLVLRQIPWSDSTAGLADATTDVAFVWLPLPGAQRYAWTVVAREPRVVALPAEHRLSTQDTVSVSDLLDEPFLALPESAGPLRDYWLAADMRLGRPPLVGAEVGSADETYEAIVDGRGVVLLASGNAPLLDRGGVVFRPVAGLPPSELALAWRRDDQRELVAEYVRACRLALGPIAAPRAH
jgi:DNA-binding transcriptional LysR family regulator